MRRRGRLAGRAALAGMLGLAASGAAVPAAAAAHKPSLHRHPAVAAASGGAGGERVVLRSGEHPGFTRLVFDLPHGAEPQVQQGAGSLVVRVPGAAFATARPAAVLGVTLTGDQATLVWAPGIQTRQSRLPDRLIIDLMHAPGVSPTGPALAPAPVTTAAPAAPAAAHDTAPVVAASPLPAAPAIPVPATQIPATQVPASPASASPALASPTFTSPAVTPAAAPAMAAAPVIAPVDAAAPAVLPFSAGTGAAAFRRGPWGIAVFDEARPLDPAAVSALPTLAAAQAQTLAGATEIRMRLAPEQSLALTQHGGFWSLAVLGGVPEMRAIHPVAAAGQLHLRLGRPGRVVTVPDPDTGGLLLVGTQAPTPAWAMRAAAAAAGGANPPNAQGVAVERRTPAFVLLATWQGVALDPGADDLVLRPAVDGYVLERTAAGQGVSLAAADGSDRIDAASAFSRLFDLPDDAAAALSRRLEATAGLAAGQPPQDRGPARLRAAQAMLALGLGAEAAGLVRLAETDDARLVDDPQAKALAAAAALLAGRTGEATGLNDPALTAPGARGADEAALWRALLAARQADAAQHGDPAAAQILAAKLPLLLSYPAPLRERLLPMALRTMALGGEAAAAQRAVDAQPHQPQLDFVRALLAEQGGRVPEALGLEDRLAQGRDPDIAARAAVRAVELRLQSHALTPQQAADALDPLIYAWRGDGRELAVRLREAALRLQAGQPRAALALLREAADPVLSQGWPEQRPALAERLHAAFAEAVARDAGEPLPPLDFLAMVQENADLLPSGAAGQALAERVADRLAALDLPDQAAATLARLVDRTPPGAARGALGARLAALQLEQHDAHAALVTLSASTSDTLPPGLVESRTLLFARATASRGNLAAATGALQALGTPAADDLQAKLLADAGQWPQATVALQRVARETLPATGMLNDSQSGLLLRLASAAAQAGDAQTLSELRDLALARVPAGRSADLLRVLTEGPVQTIADLPRAGAEMALARSALK